MCVHNCTYIRDNSGGVKKKDAYYLYARPRMVLDVLAQHAKREAGATRAIGHFTNMAVYPFPRAPTEQNSIAVSFNREAHIHTTTNRFDAFCLLLTHTHSHARRQ